MTATTAEDQAGVAAPPPSRRTRRPGLVALLFLAPALLLLGALVVYPIFFTIVRSLFDRAGDTFVGIDNYRDMFTSSRTLQAIKNNAIWVVFAPTIVTAVGLVFAVLTERIKWSTGFKVAVFMPMAISFLAAGVIWRIVYEQDPDRGLANAATAGVVELFRPPGDYPGARPSVPEAAAIGDDGAILASSPVRPGATADVGLLGLPQSVLPAGARNATRSPPAPDAISGVVWLDFTVGATGVRGEIDPTERGMPGVRVEALSGDRVAGSAVTGDTGEYAIAGLQPGEYTVRLASSNFREPYGGIAWLGPTLVTPAIIVSFVWIWAGFAMVVIGAGLAAIPRDVLEAARVDGAGEWQVFRRVTVPLLMPVLLVVLVTLSINVLKVFDLVLIIPPGSTQANANVLALEMWRVSFGGARDQGLGSALAVLLFVLVLPAMIFNLRRFKAEAQ